MGSLTFSLKFVFSSCLRAFLARPAPASTLHAFSPTRASSARRGHFIHKIGRRHISTPRFVSNAVPSLRHPLGETPKDCCARRSPAPLRFQGTARQPVRAEPTEAEKVAKEKQLRPTQGARPVERTAGTSGSEANRALGTISECLCSTLASRRLRAYVPT